MRLRTKYSNKPVDLETLAMISHGAENGCEELEQLQCDVQQLKSIIASILDFLPLTNAEKLLMTNCNGVYEEDKDENATQTR